MKIRGLTVKNFTVFEQATFEFSPGLNVVIGENATGKSHLLKLMYALLKAADGRVGTEKHGAAAEMEAGLDTKKKLIGVFKPEGNGMDRLVRRQGNPPTYDLELQTDEDKFGISFRAPRERGAAPVTIYEGATLGPLRARCVFVPPQDVLALYENFIGTYSQKALSFDETFNDICVALNAALLRDAPEWAVPVLRRLEKLIGGKVKLKGDRFYVGPFEAHLVAAGHRKLAEIVRLIANGSIAADSILFWDEPEAGLNPRLITVVGEVILQLAVAGTQIFIATHDFLLSDQLSLAAEYQTDEGKAARPRFFGLSRSKPTAGVEVESGDGLAAIRKNSILDEYAAQQERERLLFYGDIAEKGSA